MAYVDEEFLKKYHLEADGSILAGDKHKTLCAEPPAE